MSRVAVWLIRCYQRTLSRVLPPVCRFEPSCSEYMRQAIEVHGFWRGVWLGLCRLARCHPFNPGGLDEVPPRSGKDGPEPAATGDHERLAS